MLGLTILFSTVAASAVVRRNDFEVDPAGAEAAALAETEMQRLSIHCGSGEYAEFECVLECMDDRKCREQAEVVAAIREAGVFKTQQIQDGYGFSTGAPCASFYGDNA